MTPTEAKALLINPVFQAFADGKQIQKLRKGFWGDAKDVAAHEIATCPQEYRVKPEPREWWINVYNRPTCYLYQSQEEADRDASFNRRERLHVREVLP